jgi:MFS family permease
MGLAKALSPAALDAWGWRAAFLLGAAAIPVAMVLRGGLTETLDQTPPPAAGPRRPVLPLVLGFMMLAGATTVTYVLNYLTTYATTALRLPAATAFASTASFGLCGMACAPLAGWLSDRYGRKPVMLAPALILLVAALPVFGLIVRLKTAEALLGGTIVLAVCASSAFPVILCALAEWLPGRRRSGVLGLTYALAISVFGGSTQFVVAWLGRATHSPFAPAWCMTGGIAVCFAAMLMFPETAPVARIRSRRT